MRNIYIIISICIIYIVSSTLYSYALESESIIISKTKEGIILDITNQSAVGSVYDVIVSGKTIIHPKTKKVIHLEDEIIAELKIIKVTKEYAVAQILFQKENNELEEGMIIRLKSDLSVNDINLKKSISILPFQLANNDESYLGMYVSDLLVEQLYNFNKYQLVDRQYLDFRLKESKNIMTGIIDNEDSEKIGTELGIRYIIVGTISSPDIKAVSTGIPLKGIVKVVEILNKEDYGSRYVSDIEYTQLKAVVSISMKVVDIFTGEILFISTVTGQAEGEGEVKLEAGILDGLKLNGGINQFQKSILGKAFINATAYLAEDIDDYFSGRKKKSRDTTISINYNPISESNTFLRKFGIGSSGTNFLEFSPISFANWGIQPVRMPIDTTYYPYYRYVNASDIAFGFAMKGSWKKYNSLSYSIWIAYLTIDNLVYYGTYPSDPYFDFDVRLFWYFDNEIYLGIEQGVYETYSGGETYGPSHSAVILGMDLFKFCSIEIGAGLSYGSSSPEFYWFWGGSLLNIRYTF